MISPMILWVNMHQFYPVNVLALVIERLMHFFTTWGNCYTVPLFLLIDDLMFGNGID